MSDEAGEDKTEEPSERRKQKAHEEGQIAYSREIGMTLSFLSTAYILYIMGDNLALAMQNHFRDVFLHLQPFPGGMVPFDSLFYPSLKPILLILLMILMVTFISPIIGHVAQKGIEPMYEAAKPNFDKLNPMQGIKQVFSFEALVMFLKNIVKTLGFMYIFYLTIRPYTDKILHMAMLSFDESHRLTVSVFVKFATNATMFLVVIAAIDYFLNWKKLRSQLMMTKQELKEEMKEVDGNPQIKGKMRQIQQERVKRMVNKEVPKATVVITNPTHFAVALQYKKGEVPVPRVVAKGVDQIALKIREVATSHNIAIVENPPLARAIYRDVKVGKEIPYKYYKTVAKIIATILRIEEEKKRRRQQGR